MNNLTSRDCHSSIEIYRDQYGIPHIFADNTFDVFFGQGLIHAVDRPVQIQRDWEKIHGTGFGFKTHSQDRKQKDFPWWRLGLIEVATREFHRLNPHTQLVLESFAAGINLGLRHIGLGRNHSKAEFQWEPWDAIAFFKMRHLDQGALPRKLLRTNLIATGNSSLIEYLYSIKNSVPILKEYGAYNLQFDASTFIDTEEFIPEILPNDLTFSTPRGENSNSWGVNKNKSRTGLPILAGDSHRQIEVPNVYYQVHLICPEFNALGFSFPGVPGVPHFGHNDHVAWSITYGCGDNQDVYLERLDKENSSYLRNGEWHNLHFANHEIVNSKTLDASLEEGGSIWSQNGPIIWEDQDFDFGISLKWTALEEDRTFDAIYSMLFAKSCDDFCLSMRSWVDPINSLIVGDRQGNMAFRLRGRVPIRSIQNHWMIVPGWDTGFRWSGFIPYEEMPASSTYSTLITTNNPIVGDSYPHYLSVDYRSDLRSRRIVELIESFTSLDQEACRSILSDVTSLPAREWASIVSGILTQVEKGDFAGTTSVDVPASKILSIISTWNGEMSVDLEAPTLYTNFIERLIRSVWQQITGEEFPNGSKEDNEPSITRLINQLRGQVVRDLIVPNPQTNKGQLDDRLLIECLLEAYSTLQNDLSDELGGRSWGNVHLLPPEFTHASLAHLTTEKGRIPTPGDNDTVRIGAFDSNKLTCDVTESSVARYIFNVENWDDSYWILPGGISENPENPHFMDQFTLWQQDELALATFSPNLIRTHCQLSMKINPR